MRNDFRIGLLTIISAFILTMVPLPDWAQTLRPEWVALVLIYWAMALPARIGVTAAWCAGLLLDVVHGSILGQHAIGLVIIIYVVHIQHQRMRVASLLQQALVILVMLLFYKTLVLWVNGIVGRIPDVWMFFVPSLISAILWPWIYIILRDLRRQFVYRAM